MANNAYQCPRVTVLRERLPDKMGRHALKGISMAGTTHWPEGRRGLSPRQFAKLYGLGEALVYRSVKDGSIPAIKVGARYVILPEVWERKAALLEKREGDELV